MALPALITVSTSTASNKRAARGQARFDRLDARVQLQGCNPFKCAGLAIACAAACASGIGTAGCIACLGGAYEECKDCF